MEFPSRNLNQVAVYWPSPTPDGFGGYDWGAPQEIKCRWTSTIETITDAKGQEMICHATVQVAQDLEENGLLFLGTLDDLDSAQEGTPETIDNAWRIKRFDKTPTLNRPTRYCRVAYL